MLLECFRRAVATKRPMEATSKEKQYKETEEVKYSRKKKQHKRTKCSQKATESNKTEQKVYAKAKAQKPKKTEWNNQV